MSKQNRQIEIKPGIEEYVTVDKIGDAYVARAQLMGVKASSKRDRETAAQRCADRVFGTGCWVMRVLDSTSFAFRRRGGAVSRVKLQSAWRDPAVEMPDDDVAVLIRRNDPGCPISRAPHDENGWWPSEDIDTAQDVIGWMDLHEAAQILDAATRGEVADA